MFNQVAADEPRTAGDKYVHFVELLVDDAAGFSVATIGPIRKASK
jgi:hypothetical protein